MGSKYKSYEEFLNKMYPNLYFSNQVQHILKNTDNKNEAVKRYMQRLEYIHQKAFYSKRKSDLYFLKSFYYKNYVIKEEDISEKYLQFLDKNYYDKYKNHMTEETKQIYIRNIINSQKKSLDIWIDYLNSKDSVNYPMWAKYWAFQGMLTIGSYNNKSQSYERRTANTIAPFIELNKEILADCIDNIIKIVDEGKIYNLNQISGESFSKMYQNLFTQFKSYNFSKESLNGKWIKYEQGNNYMPLYNSIKGYGTGWCTAQAENICENQIREGDFYVYYSYDKSGNATIPRLAIKMNGTDKIDEIRGVAEGQNVETYLEKIVEEKLKEFSINRRYKQIVSDSKILTFILTKHQKGVELSLEELKFLYETERKISSFGETEDPRIEQIKNERNLQHDYSKIYNVNTYEITLSSTRFLNNPSKYKVLINNIDFSDLNSSKNIVLPEYMIGNLDLSNITSIDGLILPKGIVGNLYLNNLTSAKGLNLPKTIIGDLYLNNLLSADGLNLPDYIGGDLDLSSLKSADNLKFPIYIDGCLCLTDLITVKTLNLPETIIGDLKLDKLTNIDSLNLPNYVGGYLYLRELQSINELTLPKNIDGNIYLSNLTSVRKLTLPDNINGKIYLNNLVNIEYFNIPEGFDMNAIICSKEIKEQLMEKRNKRK